MVVSRWLAIPIAATSAPTMRASARRHVPAPFDGRPDLLGVVLDPPGPRKVLRQLGVPARGGRDRRIDDQRGRARRALVESENVAPRGHLSAAAGRRPRWVAGQRCYEGSRAADRVVRGARRGDRHGVNPDVRGGGSRPRPGVSATDAPRLGPPHRQATPGPRTPSTGGGGGATDPASSTRSSMRPVVTARRRRRLRPGRLDG